jgi:hypothetical protein
MAEEANAAWLDQHKFDLDAVREKVSQDEDFAAVGAVGETEETKANVCLDRQPKPMGEREAAELAKVSRPTMHDAAIVSNKAEPELKEAVRRGHVPANTAAKVADLPPEEQREVVTQAKSKKEFAKVAKKTVEG